MTCTIDFLIWEHRLDFLAPQHVWDWTLICLKQDVSILINLFCNTEQTYIVTMCTRARAGYQTGNKKPDVFNRNHFFLSNMKFFVKKSHCVWPNSNFVGHQKSHIFLPQADMSVG